MARRLVNRSILTLMMLLGITGCANQVQMERDKLRYAAVTRGTETYKIEGLDSLKAAEERATRAIADYKEHMGVYSGLLNYMNEKEDVLAQQKNLRNEIARLNAELADKDKKRSKAVPGSDKGRRSTSNAYDSTSSAQKSFGPLMAFGKVSGDSQRENPFKANTSDAKVWLSDPDQFWPGSINEVVGGATKTQIFKDAAKKQETTTTITPFAHRHPEELIRGLSSTASMGQIRDLITEPEIPELLPTSRTVSLGCLPPPDSAAFEAATKLAANLEKDGAGKLGVSSEYADKVVKLFEESERTMFLQYALFRLCEMSINSPSGFRNVFPVIMHDMVRRSAELRDVATKEAETRRAEEEKTRQKAEETKQKELDLRAVRQKAYLDCLGGKKDKDGNLYTDETATACKKTIDVSKKE
jgi:hypothetical protein